MRHKYTKILHFGDRHTEEFKKGKVNIEEKIDGSQFRIYVNKGKVECGSKSINYNDERPPDKMFNKAIEGAEVFNKSKLKDTNIFCEYLAKRKHNTMTYERIPKSHIIIFDVMIGEKYLTYEEKVKFAKKYGLEVVPKLWEGDGKKITMKLIEKLLDTDSILGKEKIEGLVFKRYDLFHDFGHLLGKLIMFKHVKEEFKERNMKEWKGNNRKGFIELITQSLKTKARWDKGIQHLRDEGSITNSPKDIGILLEAIIKDIETEEGERIKEDLWKFFWKEIKRGAVRGFPEYYKQKLLEGAFK